MTEQIDEEMPRGDAKYMTDLINRIEIRTLTKISDGLSKEIDIAYGRSGKENNIEEKQRLLGRLQGLSTAIFMVKANIHRLKYESV